MWLSSDNSNQSVVIDASPEEVWEELVDGAWLDDDREQFVETVEEHRRMVWWWGSDEGFSRVEVELVPLPGPPTHTRVIVTESFPVDARTACLTPA